MATGISSAGPEALQRYVAVSAAQAEPMAYEAAMLAAALSAFSATCTEYRVAAVEGLAARMGALETRAGDLGGWVAAVAAGFITADSGSLASRRADVGPPRAAARAGFHMRINGPLGISIDVRFTAQADAPGRLAALPLALIGVWFTGAAPLFAPVIAYQGVAAAQRWLITQLQSPAIVDLRRSVGAMLRVAGVTLQTVTLAAQQLQTGRLISPLNSLRLLRTTLNSFGLDRPLWTISDDAYSAAWAHVGVALLIALRQMNARMSGSIPSRALALPDLLVDFAPLLLIVGGATLALSTLGDGSNWPDLPADDDDWMALFHRSFWIAGQEYLPPELLHAITVEIDTLVQSVMPILASAGHVRTEPLRRDADGRLLEVDFDTAFLEDQRIPLGDGTYALRPGALMSGEQRIISYYRNEQVTLVRLNAEDFVVGICGLDPNNMAYSPNGTSAVVQTAYGADPLRNPYYTYVRDEFFRYIELIPPGSNVHLAGHSMGGGMATRLLSDPAVIAALAARNLTPQSLTTVGAVRPATRPGSLPEGLTERHYVDPDDQLAMNVGAGHTGYSGVSFLDDGDLTDPAAAHSGYAEADYSALPADLGRLPYTVDPAHYAVYRIDPIGMQPPAVPEEAPPPLYP